MQKSKQRREEIVNMKMTRTRLGKKEGPMVVRGKLVRAGGIISYVLYKNIHILTKNAFTVGKVDHVKTCK